MDKLSVVIITYNEESNIARCLDSVSALADEVVVVDSLSTDNTKTICNKYSKVRFIEHAFNGFGAQKQFAINQAQNNWVLFIDADEQLTTNLVAEIEQLKKIGFKDGGYYVHRQTFYEGKLLKHCGMRREKHLRLFNRTQGSFTQVLVHESFETKLPCKNLKNSFVHYPYKNLEHHLQKINSYTTLWATNNSENGNRSTKLKAIAKCCNRLFVILFFKLAILDGTAGIIWAIMGAYYTFLKYAKLAELSSKN